MAPLPPDAEARLRQLEIRAAGSDQKHLAVTREVEAFHLRLQELHELGIERQKEARETRAELVARLDGVDREQASALDELREVRSLLAKLTLAREVQEKTDAEIEARAAKSEAEIRDRREALKGWVAIGGGVITAGVALWGLAKLLLAFVVEIVRGGHKP